MPASRTALRRLAEYTGGYNREGLAVASARPVVERPGAPGTWLVQIGLPGLYTASAAPSAAQRQGADHCPAGRNLRRHPPARPAAGGGPHPRRRCHPCRHRRQLVGMRAGCPCFVCMRRLACCPGPAATRSRSPLPGPERQGGSSRALRRGSNMMKGRRWTIRTIGLAAASGRSRRAGTQTVTGIGDRWHRSAGGPEGDDLGGGDRAARTGIGNGAVEGRGRPMAAGEDRPPTTS